MPDPTPNTIKTDEEFAAAIERCERYLRTPGISGSMSDLLARRLGRRLLRASGGDAADIETRELISALRARICAGDLDHGDIDEIADLIDAETGSVELLGEVLACCEAGAIDEAKHVILRAYPGASLSADAHRGRVAMLARLHQPALL